MPAYKIEIVKLYSTQGRKYPLGGIPQKYINNDGNNSKKKS